MPIQKPDVPESAPPDDLPEVLPDDLPDVESRHLQTLRANAQSARCASQKRGSKTNMGHFGSKKRAKQAAVGATDDAETLPEDIVANVPVFAPKTGLPPAHTQPALTNSELAAFVAQLDVAYKAEVQNALKDAVSGMLHGIQASSQSGLAEREEAMLLWQEATAAAAASIELINIPTLQHTYLNLHVPDAHIHKRKRKRLVPSVVASHKGDRRAAHGVDNAMRDQQSSKQRAERDATELEEAAAMAVQLQSKVKAELHYSERRLVGIAAYYKARALGMSKGDAAADAARSRDVGVRTLERWTATYLSEGDGFFTHSRWGAHSKTPYLLADKTLQKQATLWVREHAALHKNDKGDMTPNMKVSDFQDYLNTELIPKFVSA